MKLTEIRPTLFEIETERGIYEIFPDGGSDLWAVVPPSMIVPQHFAATSAAAIKWAANHADEWAAQIAECEAGNCDHYTCTEGQSLVEFERRRGI